jgi:galactokinase
MNRETATYFCPGRINLIGEHIDYNGGLVMPAAISLGITGRITRNGTDSITLRSTQALDEVRVDLADVVARPGHWSDYAIGVMLALREQGIPLAGCDILYSSDLPQGAGLSSSAAMEVLTYYMLTHFHTGKEPDRTAMALVCQQVENRHIGVNCGIMDQFAVARGRSGHALLLDCSTLAFEEVPFELGPYALVIIDSKAPRRLAGSAYNQRRQECDAALSVIRQVRNIRSLVEAELTDLHLLEDVTVRRRVHHVITEQQRVKAAAAALTKSDLMQFGALLNASHESLRTDYEVSSAQLNHIVSVAQRSEGCMGARLTGAGFGGCCIALMRTDAVNAFRDRLGKSYFESFGLEVGLHLSTLSNGVRALAIR